MEQKIQIKVSDVLSMLQNGKTRDDIRDHYGLSKRDAGQLFKHPLLKGKKTLTAPNFVIVDDQVEAKVSQEEEIETTANQPLGQEEEVQQAQEETIQDVAEVAETVDVPQDIQNVVWEDERATQNENPETQAQTQQSGWEN